ncbi:MAG: peptidase C1 [bacterium]|nr:peptidase C1 [bacterium]
MQRIALIAAVVVGFVALAGLCWAEDVQRDQAVYVERTDDPILDKLKKRQKALVKEAEKKTEEILEAYREAEKARTEPRQRLRFDVSSIDKPSAPDAFTSRVWHFPPTPQYRTGTCWSFSATSFLESEIKRLHGKEIKLSEMWTAYWEFVNKAEGFVASRGESLYSHGSQAAALLRVFERRGVVPRIEYEGVVAEDGLFDHNLMVDHIKSFLEWCEESNFWDRDIVIAMVRKILDETMGAPPEVVTWNGQSLSPRAFLAEVCEINPEDYVSFISTLADPFYTEAEYDVPDNWWHDTSYVNVPLEDWYATLKSLVTAGNSVAIGGDVSEPGMNGPEDVAVIPSFDIPAELIDQSARELRFSNESSTDDHLVHVVGHTEIDGADWFLIKDSNRSSRQGQHQGYFFYRGDYVQLKMLMFTTHRDLVSEILAKVDSSNN